MNMENKCYLIDCMNFMAGVPDKAFDLAIVDPFYGHDLSGGMSSKNGFNNKEQWDKLRKENKKPDKKYFIELFRISKNQIIWGGNYFIEYLFSSQGWIVWDKKQRDFTFADGELAWSSFDKAVRIFSYSRAKCLSENKIHKFQKPVALYKWLLQNYAKPGWTILDTHEGSGSNRIACHDMGFHHEGCEIDPDIWKDQESRYQQHIAQGNLFDTNEIKELIYKQNELS